MNEAAQGLTQQAASDPHHFAVKQLADFTNEAALLVRREADGQKRNGTIQGGIRQKVAAGDLIRIPAKTPHQFFLDGAKEFTYIVLKVKGY